MKCSHPSLCTTRAGCQEMGRGEEKFLSYGKAEVVQGMGPILGSREFTNGNTLGRSCCMKHEGKVEYSFNILEAKLMVLQQLILRKQNCGRKGGLF